MTDLRRLSTQPPTVILVADADEEAARRLVDHLASRGFAAAYTSRGEDALRRARAGRVWLAIVDVSLLDMSGYALASWLKGIDRQIPIIMTTADYRPEIEMRARQVGAFHYAQKPVDYQRLETVVAKALNSEVRQVVQRTSRAERAR